MTVRNTQARLAMTCITFLPRYQKKPFRRPSGEQGIVIDPLSSTAMAPGSNFKISNLHLLTLAIGKDGKRRKITVMILDPMQLDRSLGPAEFCPACNVPGGSGKPACSGAVLFDIPARFSYKP